jgi:hypothetical protein
MGIEHRIISVLSPTCSAQLPAQLPASQALAPQQAAATTGNICQFVQTTCACSNMYVYGFDTGGGAPNVDAAS